MPPFDRMGDRCRLMRVHLLDAARREHLPQPDINRIWKWLVPCGAGREASNRCHPAVRTVRILGHSSRQAFDDRLQHLIVSRIGSPGWQHDRRW
jgi:hypothetical protein